MELSLQLLVMFLIRFSLRRLEIYKAVLSAAPVDAVYSRSFSDDRKVHSRHHQPKEQVIQKEQEGSSEASESVL